jgi:ubiquinone/menaquinone biosynthesis C-methylase UbiE
LFSIIVEGKAIQSKQASGDKMIEMSQNETKAAASALLNPASFLVPAREDAPEMLDEGAGSVEEVHLSLDEMVLINQVFGGYSALSRYLKPQLEKAGQSVSIVDIGAGSGTLALSLVNWAKRQQIKLEIYPLDFSERHLSIAHETIQSKPNIQLIQANALALPFASCQIDYFISCLFMHHLQPEEIIKLLRDSYQLAKRGIVMSDIVRSHLHLLAFRFIQPIFARNFLTRHDAAVSIKRAYTVEELKAFAKAAGIENARVYSHFPWRMTIEAHKDEI